jgi:CRISPR-associated endonuclease Cas1
MQSQATSPLPPLEPRDGVLVVDGYGVKVSVNRGHLVVEDGFADLRRSGRFSRSTSGLRRVVLLGHAGFVTLEAIRWLADVGAAYLHIDRSGRVLATSAVLGVDHPALRRAQAKAWGTPAGSDIAREILRQKLRGQLTTLVAVPDAEDARLKVERAYRALGHATDVESLRALEARAAAAYWGAWEGIPTSFSRSDARRVPGHWQHFIRRGSPLTGNPRLAADPANAMLNYLYGLLEAEARIASLAVGLDPGHGVLHADQRARDSLALDLMEAVRPEVDAYVLDLLSSHVFRAKDFHETRQGTCRLVPPLTHVLAATATAWAAHVGPIAEGVAQTLGTEAGLRPADIPTPLTQDNRSRGRDGIRTGARRNPTRKPTQPPTGCRLCGLVITRGRAYCNKCLGDAHREALNLASEAATRVLAQMRAAGRDPAHGGEAARKRASSLSMRQEEAKAFERKSVTLPSAEIFEREILPRLQSVTVPAMARATGLTRAYCSMIRRGVYVPHPRHWEVLRGLTQEP